ncbi:MAG: hypothetical protein OHK0024_22490 [Thalassobaculales bacterium]
MAAAGLGLFLPAAAELRVAAGLLALLAAALVHVAVVLHLRLRRLERRVGGLARLTRQVEARLADDDSPGASDLTRVVAEVRVLQDLVERLFDGRGEGTAAALAPALAEDDDHAILEAVREGLRNDRVEMELQPIFALPSRKPAFFEAFCRIRGDDGRLVEPAQFLELAERAGLVTAIDNMTLFRLVQLVRRSRKAYGDARFFLNISPRSLADEAFLDQFIEFLAANRLGNLLFFEFAQGAFSPYDPATQEALARLQEAGYRFSLDNITDLDLDLPDLAALGFKFVKIEAGLLLQHMRHDPPLLDMRLLKGALDREAMDLIVDKIESEKDVLELIEHKVDFGQGYHLGAPKPAQG